MCSQPAVVQQVEALLSGTILFEKIPRAREHSALMNRALAAAEKCSPEVARKHEETVEKVDTLHKVFAAVKSSDTTPAKACRGP